MSALTAKAAQQPVQQAQKKPDVSDIINRLKPEIARALPSVMNADRVARIALTELRTNPKLAEAALSNQGSFMGAMLKASALGLEVGNGLGHAYLLPFDKKAKQGGQWVTVATETQLIIGYRGMIELARRSGQIESLYAVEVYHGETFEVSMGLEQNIIHKRDFTGSVDMRPENVIAVYAVAKLKGGMVQFDVMTRVQVEAIRSRSKAKDSGPWVSDWVEMAKKTVLRRLFKMLPVSVEVQTKTESRAISLDTLANDDGGFNVNTSGGIDIDAYQEPVIDHQPQLPDPDDDIPDFKPNRTQVDQQTGELLL
jgi:recombination protein RecT